MNDIKKAVEKVIKSYSKDIISGSKEDQILVQSQTKDVIMSGVIFSRNIENNSPYYLINYDNSSVTDSVTSGKVGNKLEIRKNVSLKKLKPIWKSLLKSVKEVESLLDNLALDIEFAIKKNGEVVIFQVRPITVNKQIIDVTDENINTTIKELIQKYNKDSKYSILKQNYTLSDMSFWNPAEIIGDRASNLSYSIYRYLILSKAWNTGLLPLGYKKIDRDIMVRYGNKPYIEVETSFMALLPNSLDNGITNKLIKYYRNKLEKNPELHDKIEFEIVHNCFSPDTDDELSELKGFLNKKEINIFRKALIKLTQNIFDNYNDIKENDQHSLNILADKRNELISNIKNLSIHQKLDGVMTLLDDAIEFGTPQFSRMARLAFIGKNYLNSMVEKGIINQKEYEIFFSKIDTIATEINKDFKSVMMKKIPVSRFNKLYGHLRPGTYDITKLPYNKDKGYFKINNFVIDEQSVGMGMKNGSISIEKKINNFLKNFEISISSSQLLNFIKESTVYRESFKFEFTKNLSLALEIFVEVGQELGFDRQMLSHLSIESIQGIIYSNSSKSEIVDFWQSQIFGKKNKDHIYKYIALPSLIFNDKDFEIIHSHTVRPNYITNSLVKGELINLDSLDPKNYNLVSGKIVLIEKADPGYDWVFSKGIKGLITRFGGAASHMAIRCAEFKIPAAIGCGEIIYKNIKSKHSVFLDCKSKLINVI